MGKGGPPPADPAGMDPAMVAAVAIIMLTTVALAFFFLSGGKKAKFLNKERQQLVLGEKTYISHDTVRFRLKLPAATPILGLPVGKHFKIFAPAPKASTAGKWNGRDDPEAEETEIERKYTPTTSDDTVGHVDLVIKVYKGGVKEQFPDGGKMSQYMDSLSVGDKVTLSGPWGMNEYLGNGKFKIGKSDRSCKKLGMMAGGTGITPMLQVMTQILRDKSDPTQISLIYANQSEDDILVRDMLEALQKEHPGRLKLWYTLDNPKPGWAYSKGFITEEMIKEHLPGPNEDSLVLMCGPPPMVKFACQQNLDKLGFTKQQQVAF